MKRSMVVLVAVMLCLTLMGVAYAAWTQNIFISGNVATGTLDIIWTQVSLDRAGEPQYNSNYVASVSTPTLSDNNHTITYTVTNAFPGWSSKLKCKIQNAGTIPANLAVGLNTSSSDIVVSYENIPPSLAANATTDDIVVTVSVPTTVTSQNQSYTFTLTVTGTQFNITP